MRDGIALRDDFSSFDLRRLAKGSRDAGQARRLLALAEIYDGASRTDAAQIGAVGLQTVREAGRGQIRVWFSAKRIVSHALSRARQPSHAAEKAADRPCCSRGFQGTLSPVTCKKTTIARGEPGWTSPPGALRAAHGGLR